MTALSILADARAAGLVLRAEGERLRVRPRGLLTSELRARLSASKAEVIELLSTRQRAAAGQWSAAFLRLRSCGWPGRDVIAVLRPDLRARVEAFETAAEAATVGYLSGEVERQRFEIALADWETQVRAAARGLDRGCHDCGEESVALVGTDWGARHCRRCLSRG